jgi:hypothetical protein
MMPDRYTKVMLTVIAVMQIALWVRDLTPGVQAQGSDPQRVVIVGLEQPLRGLPVVLVRQSGVPVTDDQPFPIAVVNDAEPLRVAVTSIQQSRDGSWDPIRVDVLRQPPSLRPGQ